MIRKFTLTLAIASLLLGAAISASAQKKGVGYLGPPVREGQNARHNQRRLRQGVRSGELTKREARRLERQQTVINKAFKNGDVTQNIPVFDFYDFQSSSQSSSWNPYKSDTRYYIYPSTTEMYCILSSFYELK